jgi:hypothetical protein
MPKMNTQVEPHEIAIFVQAIMSAALSANPGPSVTMNEKRGAQLGAAFNAFYKVVAEAEVSPLPPAARRNSKAPTSRGSKSKATRR